MTSTIYEHASAAALAVGVFLVGGLGWALIAAGVAGFLLAQAYGLDTDGGDE